MSHQAPAVVLALLQKDVEALKVKEAENEKKIAALELQDKNRMRWAIGSLGTLVLALGTYIWQFKVDGK